MDDVTLLATDVLSIRRAMDLTDWYGQASGAKLNRSNSSSVMMSQKRSDPFAMFNKINVKADRGRSTASGISQGNKLIYSLPGVGRGRRQARLGQNQKQ